MQKQCMKDGDKNRRKKRKSQKWRIKSARWHSKPVTFESHNDSAETDSLRFTSHESWRLKKNPHIALHNHSVCVCVCDTIVRRHRVTEVENVLYQHHLSMNNYFIDDKIEFIMPNADILFILLSTEIN